MPYALEDYYKDKCSPQPPSPIALDGSMRGFMRGKIRCGVVIIGSVLLGSLVSACSSPPSTREYATPKTLCHTKISSAALTPLLPPGRKISAQPTSSVGIDRCRLEIDGKIAFSSSIEQRGTDVSAKEVAKSAIGVDPSDSASGDGRFIYSKTGAVGSVECQKPTDQDSAPWVTARVSEATTAETMRRFIEEYAGAVAKTDACKNARH